MITLEQLKEFSKGDKITIYKKDIMNNPFSIKCTLVNDEFVEWGYYKQNCGWSLYKGSDAEEVCYKLEVRLYKNRNSHVFKTEFEIIDIKKGWH